MKPETIKRRIARVRAAIEAHFNRVIVYDVFFFPGRKVIATANAGDIKQYEADNNAVFIDILIRSPEPGEKGISPDEMDITADYKENHKTLYERGLKKWLTDRLSAEVTAGM